MLARWRSADTDTMLLLGFLTCSAVVPSPGDSAHRPTAISTTPTRALIRMDLNLLHIQGRLPELALCDSPLMEHDVAMPAVVKQETCNLDNGLRGDPIQHRYDTAWHVRAVTRYQ